MHYCYKNCNKNIQGWGYCRSRCQQRHSEEDKMIINLSKLSKKDISIAGGKAANLGELIQAGFNVPGGVCVTTDTFGYFQKNEKFPLGFEKELNAKLAKLKGPFAVRSSATTE